MLEKLYGKRISKLIPILRGNNCTRECIPFNTDMAVQHLLKNCCRIAHRAPMNDWLMLVGF